MAELRAIEALAGRHAENRAGYDADGLTRHFFLAIDLADDLTESDRQWSAYIDYLEIVAEDTFAIPSVWRAVEALAERLLQAGTLYWAEARDVIESALWSR